jgi:hypothetical protein
VDHEPARIVADDAPSGAEAATVDAWLAAAWAQRHDSRPDPVARSAESARAGEEAPEPARGRPHPSSEPGGKAPARPGGIRERLRDPDPMIRAAALRELEDPSAADAAAAAMADDAPAVRREAARTLGRLDGPRAGRWLVDALSADPSPDVRIEAVEALAALITRQPDGRGGRDR